MASARNNLFFTTFIVTLLSVCVVGLMVMQVINPVDTGTDIPRASFTQLYETPVEIDTPNALTPQELEDNFYYLENIQKTFEALDYSMEKIMAQKVSVPQLYLKRLPRDLNRLENIQQRKDIFFMTLLPLILKENQTVLARRARIFRLSHRLKLGQFIRAKDKLWLETQFSRYSVKTGHFENLLKKVDQIPPSLAIAQAAEESGWGTSRFVREGNALFGQWTFNPNDKGIVPSQRSGNKTHRIKAFNRLGDSLRAYVFNLNSHKAYGDFRQKRAELRRNPSQLGSRRLANALGQYSERGEKYVQGLQALIRQNDLKRFDQLDLDQNQGPIDYQNLFKETPQLDDKAS